MLVPSKRKLLQGSALAIVTGMVLVNLTNGYNPNKAEAKSNNEKLHINLSGHEWGQLEADFVSNNKFMNSIYVTNEKTYEFLPGKSTTRDEVITSLVKFLDLKKPDVVPSNYIPFVDVNAKFSYAIEIANMLELVNGTGDNMFSPDSTLTREDMLTMTFKVLEKLNKITPSLNENVLKSFSDTADISPYARTAIATLVNNNIISGSDGKINPKQLATRIELASLIYQLNNSFGVISHSSSERSHSLYTDSSNTVTIKYPESWFFISTDYSLETSDEYYMDFSENDFDYVNAVWLDYENVKDDFFPNANLIITKDIGLTQEIFLDKNYLSEFSEISHKELEDVLVKLEFLQDFELHNFSNKRFITSKYTHMAYQDFQVAVYQAITFSDNGDMITLTFVTLPELLDSMLPTYNEILTSLVIN
jgi:hypothetical protein